MSIGTGIATLANWLGEGGKPVDSATSTARARACLNCRYNKKINWKNLFKEGIADAVLAYERVRRGNNIGTKHDVALGECDRCGCMLRLKVHVPLDHITQQMGEEDWADLPAWCWVRLEAFRKEQQQ